MLWKLGTATLILLLGLAGCERVEGTSVDWDTDFESSLEEAKEVGQPTLVYFTADWCTICREFEGDVASSPRLQQELAAFNLIKVDVDQSPQILDRYNLMGAPSWQILDQEGLPVGKISGYGGDQEFRRTLNEFSL
ncbi:MAG: thioredoxin family protein [Fimbriimonadaceae bacterium]